MKLNFKIDPYNFPILIIVAFVIGMILAMALGFRPARGSHDDRQGHQAPALVQSAPSWDGFNG